MRVMVTGSRNWTDNNPVFRKLEFLEPFKDILILGDASGVDAIALKYATLNKIQYRLFRADWNRWGKAAGPKRNREMVDNGRPDVVVGFRNYGISPGTDDALSYAKSRGIPVVIYRIVLEVENEEALSTLRSS